MYSARNVMQIKCLSMQILLAGLYENSKLNYITGAGIYVNLRTWRESIWRRIWHYRRIIKNNLGKKIEQLWRGTCIARRKKELSNGMADVKNGKDKKN